MKAFSSKILLISSLSGIAYFIAKYRLHWLYPSIITLLNHFLVIGWSL